MRTPRVVAVLVVSSLAGVATAQSAPCDSGALRDVADTARVNIIDAVDGAATLDAWRTVLDSGGAIGWAVTEYNVDARSSFVFAFDRSSLRVYRAGAFGASTDAAMAGASTLPWSPRP